MKLKFFLLLLLPLTASVAAQSSGPAVYRCTDANDQITFTNLVDKQAKDCTKVDLPVDNVISAPPVKNQRPRDRTTNKTKPDYPSVGAGEQAARDSERRFILEQELTEELKKLSQAQLELSQQQAKKADTGMLQEQVKWHQRNVDEMKREIDKLK